VVNHQTIACAQDLFGRAVGEHDPVRGVEQEHAVREEIECGGRAVGERLRGRQTTMELQRALQMGHQRFEEAGFFRPEWRTLVAAIDRQHGHAPLLYFDRAGDAAHDAVTSPEVVVEGGALHLGVRDQLLANRNRSRRQASNRRAARPGVERRPVGDVCADVLRREPRAHGNAGLVSGEIVGDEVGSGSTE
jgi:hypothetical protein